MLASVRQAMPYALVTHMTDKATPKLDADVRVEAAQNLPLMTYRMRHLAGLPAGEWVILDTDVVVQRDLAGVANGYDACLTRREVCYDRDGNNVAEWMPYNTGVMWCNSPAFWRDAYKVCGKLPERLQKWYGDQVSVRLVAESGRHKVREVDVNPWNYSPEREDEDVSGVAVVHYKGKRKGWMRCRSQATQS